MGLLNAFLHVSLDGYFVDRNGQMNWAHAAADDPEWNEFVVGNAKGGGTLLFGRVTYQMMAGFWPTPMAWQAMPAVAERMNSCPKVVFSRSLPTADWTNTTLYKDDLLGAVSKLKASPAPITILGSGSIVSQLSAARLIDQYQLVVNPLALGGGRTPFEGLPGSMRLKRTESRAFHNGNVLLTYQPAT